MSVGSLGAVGGGYVRAKSKGSGSGTRQEAVPGAARARGTSARDVQGSFAKACGQLCPQAPRSVGKR